MRGGSGGFRKRGRSSNSPYWKDKQQQGNEPEMTPKREPLLNHSPPEQSPVEGRPPMEARQPKEIKKFANKARLFIANLPRDTTEDELKELFSPFGEVQEVFVQKEKSFAFARMVSLCVGVWVCE